MADWISVKERLPSSSEDFLIIYEYDIIIGFYKPFKDHVGDIPKGWYIAINEAMIPLRKVTHWMPLPNLPKEKTK